MENKEKYARLLDYFNGKQYNLDEVSDVLDKVITTVKEKGTNHSFHLAGCAWAIMTLYKKGKCNLVQMDDLIEEFFEYSNGYSDYINSIVLGDKDDATLTYYNGFVHKKIKGD